MVAFVRQKPYAFFILLVWRYTMKIAFVLLYLTFGASGTEEVPMRFATMEECQATFDAIRQRGIGSEARWSKRNVGFPSGVCVPMMLSK